MVQHRLPFLIALVTVSTVLAGCIGGDDAVEQIDTPATTPTTDVNNTTTLGPLDAPTWAVGQWWAHHTYRGYEDATGTHFNVLVVSTEGGYKVAPESVELATQEAEEDVWDIGMFSASDLSTTRGGEAWSWYQWPLEHNKTWSQSIDVQGTTYDLTFTVLYNATLRTAQGDLEGFDIVGKTADNVTVLTYDYVPELGWFSDLELYHPAVSTDDPFYQIMNMGFGMGRTGDYVEVTLEPVVSYMNAINASAPSNDLTKTFTVPENTKTLRGSVVLSADTGVATLQLADPDGDTEDWTVNPPGGTIAEEVAIGSPKAGDWTLTFAGLGPAVWTNLELEAVVETVGTL